MKTLFIGLSAALFLIPATARAQLVPDRTLGRESSVVVPVSNTREDIRGGARRGSNLFHSFREFNVNTNREVYFSNPVGVQNIINRVTGSNVSNIFGTLGVSGNANLYLINPNGIVFGDGAFLDINGTFIGTTADGVRLGANDVYSASDPASSSLLTIQPSALFVNRKNAQIRTILNQGNLEANPGANVTLSADEINNSGSITVPGGNVLIEAVNGDINTSNISVSSVFRNEEATGNGGNISLISSGNINVLDGSDIFADGILSGNINIESQGDLKASNAAITSVSTGNVIGKGGDINVNARLIELNNSFLFSTTSGRGNGGDLNITAKNIALIRSDVNGNSSGLFAQSNSGATGNAGNLTIKTDTLSIRDGAAVSAGTFSDGNGGDLNITAKNIEAIGVDSVDGSASRLSAQSNPGATGDAGNLTISTDTLSILDGAQISAGTFSNGNGGNLNITAKNIEAIGVNSDGFPSGLFARSESGATGDAGNLTISTDTLSIRDGAEISASTISDGNGGDLNITAKNIFAIGVDPDGFSSGLFARSESGATGDAGDLTISTDTLSILDGAVVSASTFSDGNGGNLNITAKNIEAIGSNSVNGNPSGLFASSNSGATGNAGDLTIKTDTLSILDGAQISASTFSDGNGGDLNITAKNIEAIGVDQFDGSAPSGLFAATSGEGDAGDLTIKTDTLSILDGAVVSASTFSDGNGGNLNITAKNIAAIGVNPVVNNASSGLFTQTQGAGNAGELTVRTNDLLISDRAVISAASGGTGNGNNVNLFADNIRIENNGRIEVLSRGSGEVGNLNIQGNSLKLDRGRLNAESDIGAGGNINITLTESLSLTNSSRITAEAGVDRVGTGEGGDITIDSRLIIATPENNRITANAFGGNGGNINITTNAILGYPQFLTITASSELGIDGTINITGVTDLNSDILPAEPVTITTTPPQLAKCPIQGQSTEVNSEIDYGTGEKIKLEIFRRKNSDPEEEQQKQHKQPESKSKPSKPAVGWYRRTDGTVVLTDNPAKVRPLNQPIDYPPGCGN